MLMSYQQIISLQKQQIFMTQLPYSPNHIIENSNKLSFAASPVSDGYPTVSKAALLDSRRASILKDRAELFAEEKKQNITHLNINKTCSKEFVEQLCNQHRIEVEKLLLQISRLHDLVEDLQRQNRHQINRVKEQSQQLAMMRISSLRQCQFEELQALETNLKAYKKNYGNLQQQLQELKTSSQKKIEELCRENKEQQETIKKLVGEKNEEIYNEKKKNEREVERIILEKEIQVSEMKQCMEKQMKKIKTRFQNKQREINTLKGQTEEQRKYQQQIQERMQKQKQQLLTRLEDNIMKHKNKEQEVTQKLKRFYEQSLVKMEDQRHQIAEDYQMEINQLLEIIKLKNRQIQRNLVYQQTQKLEKKYMNNFMEEEIKYLRECLKKERIQHLQQRQLLKTKMALLHQNDIESLTKLYEKRIENLVVTNRRAEVLLEETENKLIEQKKEFYERKKKYDYKVSKLQQQIVSLRLGMGTIESSMKEKLDNEKSMMIFTSKNFIKQVEVKTANNKFYEEELRKLRHLLDIQANELEESEKNVEEKIKLAEDQLSRLSNKILEVKAEADESEDKYKTMIQAKDEEIKRLNELLNTHHEENKKNNEENDEYNKLEEQLNQVQDQLGSYKMRCQELEDQVRSLKSEGQRLMIEAQINSEDAKKHYKSISDKNLNDVKNFYERRIRQLENDKRELQRINSNQTQHITQLIKKYKEVEQSLKEFIKQSKKRGDLEHKIIHLGIDQNLVKNMAELFKK